MNSLLASTYKKLYTLRRGFDISVIYSQIESTLCTRGYQVYYLHTCQSTTARRNDNLMMSISSGSPGPTPAARARSKHPWHRPHSHSLTGVCLGTLPRFMAYHHILRGGYTKDKVIISAQANHMHAGKTQGR